MTKRLPIVAGAGLAFTVGVAGWVMKAKDLPGRTPNLRINFVQPAQGQTPAAQTSGKLKPGADDGKVASVVAQVLQSNHYLHKPLNAETSSRWMDRYLDTLDPRHLYFLKSDIEEFGAWRDKLGELALKQDTSPADLIFARLLERIDQQTAYADEQLKTEKFDFTSNDTFTIDRKKEPHPADLAEAKQLWNQFLRYEYLQEKLNKQKPEEITKALTRRYARNAHSLHELDAGDVLEIYMGSLAHVYDPHSDYRGKSSTEQFNIQMRLSLFGIGALLQSEDGYAKIEELTPGGPAIKSNQLKVGDRIVSVAQGDDPPVDTVDMRLDKVVAMIRGQKGTKVRLTVIPAGAPDTSTRKTIVLIRDQVKLEEQEAKARILDVSAGGKNNRLGIIELPSFYADFSNKGTGKSTTTDVAKLLKKLEAEHINGLILDLRGNPGGSLDEVIQLAGLFVKQGPVVQVKSSRGATKVWKENDAREPYAGPMIVLTSKGSASASEILAGALQDYGRAVIVGDSSTFGKGTVQTVEPIGEVMQANNITTASDPGSLTFTIQKFYRPSGASTQLEGVKSDIVVPALTNYIDYGEKTLEDPLPYDELPSAKFAPENEVKSVLPELKKRSEARVATDKDFGELRKEIEQFKKALAQKTVSLNEEQRLKEKQEAEARIKERKKQLLARPKSNEKEYLITLKLADQPGLPPATDPTAAKKTPATKKPESDDPSATAGSDVPTPLVDTTLDETKRILLDLITLSGKVPAGTARR